MKVKPTIILAAIMLLVGLCVRVASCQPHTHKSNREFWDNVRILPVKVLSLTKERLEYQFEDKSVIELGSLVIDIHSRVLEPKSGKLYVIVYCEEHKILYSMDEFRPANQPP